MVTTGVAAELAMLDAVGQAELVRQREVTPLELVEAAVERIERLNPVLNAVVTPDFERACDSARTGLGGPLAGVPYLVKDLIAEVAGLRHTEGSRFLAANAATADSDLVVRLREAGLVVMGLTSTPEFGMVPTCEPALFGPTRNPWDTARSTSGSSGGSGAAVASGMVPAAHANDLGGSIRFPASACGLFGLKPSRGRVPLGPHAGDGISGWLVEHTITRSVRDSAAILDATGGGTPGSPWFAPPPHRAFREEVGVDPGRLRIAYSARTPDGARGHPDCVAALDDAVALCASLGHDLLEADLPGLTPEVGAAIGTVYGATATWFVSRWVRRLGREPRHDELEPGTWYFLDEGRRVTGGDYLYALERVETFCREVAAFFREIDVWVTPTMSAPPAPLGAIVSTGDEPRRALDEGAPTVAYPAVAANMTGNPAMSVPLYWNADSLPIGVHFLGRRNDEVTLFRLAGQLEAVRPWARRLPPVHASLGT